jgi:crotonobetainyl-CoA:carnitine CoA-transferase CaiB-like acyl-CoA transferase
LKSAPIAANPPTSQVAANEMIVESVHPFAGPMRQPRPAARYEGTPTIVQRPAPALGEHTDAILAEIGIAPERITELRASGVIA